MPMTNHYGTNRPMLHPSFEMRGHKNAQDRSLSNNGRSLPYPGIPANDSRHAANNVKIISPLLTKRKNSQRSSGNPSITDRKSTERPKILKLSADANNQVYLKGQLDPRSHAQEALIKADRIQKSLMTGKSKFTVRNSSNRNPADLSGNLRSLEDLPDTNQLMSQKAGFLPGHISSFFMAKPETGIVLPTSTISSNNRRNIQSRQSSRNSRNRSTSSTNKQSQKFLMGKSKKAAKMKNKQKLE